MSKEFAAVGAFMENGSTAQAPAEMTNTLAELEAIIAKYEIGDVLSEEDGAIIEAYLNAVGADATSTSPDGAQLGTGAYEFERNFGPLAVKAEGRAGCEFVGEGRIEQSQVMKVTKTGGDARVLNMRYTFTMASFGKGDQGVLKLLFKREKSREFERVDASETSYYDRSVFIQMGFLYTAKCEVDTTAGTFVVA